MEQKGSKTIPSWTSHQMKRQMWGSATWEFQKKWVCKKERKNKNQDHYCMQTSLNKILVDQLNSCFVLATKTAVVAVITKGHLNVGKFSTRNIAATRFLREPPWMMRFCGNPWDFDGYLTVMAQEQNVFRFRGLKTQSYDVWLSCQARKVYFINFILYSCGQSRILKNKPSLISGLWTWVHLGAPTWNGKKPSAASGYPKRLGRTSVWCSPCHHPTPEPLRVTCIPDSKCSISCALW